MKYWYKFLGWICRSKNPKTHWNRRIFFGFYSEDGEPLKCIHCGYDEFIEVPLDFIQNTMCESVHKCKRCKKEVAYWAYGSFNYY